MKISYQKLTRSSHVFLCFLSECLTGRTCDRWKYHEVAKMFSGFSGLQLEPMLGNLPIFPRQSFRQGHDVGAVVVEEKIPAEERHSPRGRH